MTSKKSLDIVNPSQTKRVLNPPFTHFDGKIAVVFESHTFLLYTKMFENKDFITSKS